MQQIHSLSISSIYGYYNSVLLTDTALLNSCLQFAVMIQEGRWDSVSQHSQFLHNKVKKSGSQIIKQYMQAKVPFNKFSLYSDNTTETFKVKEKWKYSYYIFN